MSLIENGDSNPPTDPPANFSSGSNSGEESVKMSLTGIQKAVDRMIHLLHRHNIIDAGAWSRPIAIKNTNEVIRVADRTVQID